MDIIKSIKVEFTEEFFVIGGYIYSIIAEDDINFRRNVFSLLLHKMIDMNIDQSEMAIAIEIASAALVGDSEEERYEKAREVATKLISKSIVSKLSEETEEGFNIINKLMGKVQILDNEASTSILDEIFNKLSDYPGIYAESKTGDEN